MEHLKFAPNVFVVRDNYDIVVVCDTEGKCFITVGDEMFIEGGSGIFKIHTLVHKFTVPQSKLDAAGEYTVYFSACPDKKPYWTEMKESSSETFSFKPLTKTESINLYYTADIHSFYEEAEKCCSFFGDDLDVLVVNGDFGESHSREDIEALNKFIANVTGGNLPVIIGRGNHDTRGKMSEFITDYIATDNGKTYFPYTLGCISGIILDCGEDKLDISAEYGGVNYFERYRREELTTLRELGPLPKDKYLISFCHIPFTYKFKDDVFNIDTELYTEWSSELERIGTDILMCGHMHNYTVCPGEHEEHIAHTYPIVVAAEKHGDELGGCAVTLMKDNIICRFTNAKHEITREIKIDR